jgi:succinoglycan biosynthesis protein ExoM
MLNSRPIYGDAAVVARITLGVCTFRRPQMLIECLSSLAQLLAPWETEISIVVVDNEASAQTREIVELYAAQSNHPMRYIAEPRRGIATARNAIVEAALADGADWIAMLDDDQVVEPNWLRKMKTAQMRGSADVVKSSVAYEHPSPAPAWSFPRTKPFSSRFDLRTTQTNGVLFRASLVRPVTGDGRQLGLRFDEQFNLSSGVDRDFFARAYDRGAFIVQTKDAVATEFVPETKCSFSAQVARVYWQEVTNTVQDRRPFNRLHIMVSQSFRCLRHTLTGLLLMIVGSLAFPFRRRYGRQQILRGATKLARAAGVCVGILGAAKPQPYLTIHGS